MDYNHAAQAVYIERSVPNAPTHVLDVLAHGPADCRSRDGLGAGGLRASQLDGAAAGLLNQAFKHASATHAPVGSGGFKPSPTLSQMAPRSQRSDYDRERIEHHAHIERSSKNEGSMISDYFRPCSDIMKKGALE